MLENIEENIKINPVFKDKSLLLSLLKFVN